MQDRYVGDVGDFGKYALLRALAAGPLRLGVVWCLFPDESHNADGRHVAYLDRSDLRQLDPDLYDRLRAIVGNSRRSISAISDDEVLPRRTVFFGDLATPTIRVPRAERIVHRRRWLHGALEATANCGAVFFDPDNGLEVRSIPPHSPKAGKYIFWRELDTFWRRGQSLIVYHHTNRTKSVAEQAQDLKTLFEGRYPSARLLRCLLFRRGSCRLFWLVGQRRHAVAMSQAVDVLLASDFGRLFEEN